MLVVVVDVLAPSKLDYRFPGLDWDRVGGLSPAVTVGEGGRSLLAIGRQNPPNLSNRQLQQLGRFTRGQEPTVNPGEDLVPPQFL